MFFARGFSNLHKLLRRRDLDGQTTLFVGALHSSMVGFVVGALFSPEAYQFFPYFAVAYTAVLVATVSEQDRAGKPAVTGELGNWRRGEVLAKSRNVDALPLTR